MRFEHADRRRLAWASVLTVAAFPAVWFANQQGETSRPNTAAVGLRVENAAPASTSPGPVHPMGAETDPLYLSTTPPQPVQPEPQVAFGTEEDTFVARVDATFRRGVGGEQSCWYNGVNGGDYITVLNPANGRSIECWTALRPDDLDSIITLDPRAFSELADLTDAPVQVEIRQ